MTDHKETILEYETLPAYWRSLLTLIIFLLQVVRHLEEQIHEDYESATIFRSGINQSVGDRLRNTPTTPA